LAAALDDVRVRDARAVEGLGRAHVITPRPG
jgi:hypothetical protein